MDEKSISTTGFSQSFFIDWQACFGGSEWDKPIDMIEVSDGYLIVGNTKSSDGGISLNHGEVKGKAKFVVR